ncbi:TetR/AcrR family transcriptional regulator [Ruania alba]|uniref:DNA-binding transcriptional regulator, AcrR family n=1 Tax=Ruania alba TaxID=648782 RepID=A0A1H5N4V9_9MICO|nr:TetR family transcriptional regulator [Ruania alba]SEE95947.1 DNA-binding transcriptional regulator, AcrR family [Ruania alba]
MMDEARREAPQPGSTPERILAAAVRRFGADGFGVGLREIGADAGVSAALVIRHYGSKDGLRRACDEHVLTEVRRVKMESVGATDTRSLLEQLAHIEEFAPLTGYVIASLIDGGELARDLIEHMIADAVDYMAEGERTGKIKPSRDPEARARYLTYSGLGGLLLQIRLAQVDGPRDPVAMLRTYMEKSMIPSLELYTEGIFTDSRILDAVLEAGYGHQQNGAIPAPHDVATDPPNETSAPPGQHAR